MPTARPSIVASVGATDDTSTTSDSAVMPVTPMPTPTSAVSSGRPAAPREPRRRGAAREPVAGGVADLVRGHGVDHVAEADALVLGERARLERVADAGDVGG